MNDKMKPPTGGGCPGTAMRQFEAQVKNEARGNTESQSQLAQWPVQLELVPPNAPYFKDADLAITADCVPFAYGEFHRDFLKGRPIGVACPKHDHPEKFILKMVDIFKQSRPGSVEVLVMEVPCCNGLVQATRIAREQAGVDIPIRVTTIGVRGENFGTRELD